MLALLALAAAAHAADTVLAAKSFPASGVSKILIYTEAGDVKLAVEKVDEISVQAVKPADSEGHCELKLHAEAGTLTLEARKRKDLDAICDGGFVVKAAPSAAIEAYTGSGAVEASGVTRSLKARTGSGDVSLKALRGRAYVMTGSGAVRAELRGGALDARTGSGDVSASVQEPTGFVSARTGSGSVDVSLPKGARAHVRTKTASGSVANPFGDDPKSPLLVEAYTASGDVTLKAVDGDVARRHRAAPKESAAVVNDSGDEVRDLWIGVPGGSVLKGGTMTSLKAGARAAFPLPAGGASKLTLLFQRRGGAKIDKTVTTMGGSATFTITKDGVVVSMQP